MCGEVGLRPRGVVGCAVVMDEHIEAPDQCLHLPEPSDDRLRAIADLLRANSAQAATLVDLGRIARASS